MRGYPLRRAKQVWKRRWVRLVFLITALGLLLGLGLAAQVRQYGLVDRAAPADVIVVLGAGLYPNGQPNPGMTRRAEHAAALYAAGYAPWVICSGGFTVGVPVSEAAACADLLVARGVPREVILLEENSLSTEENAIYTAALMRAHGWQTALVTSDDYHLWRTTLLFQAHGVALTTSPAQVTTGPIPPDQYLVSLGREVAALVWLTIKNALGLPFTHTLL
jgi:uncharacterized SAM-binding protein YcdF (DUF218 family)